jgi:outer membrane protein
MKTINTTLAVFLLLVSTLAYAQQAAPVTMSLSEAQAYAAKNSYSLHYSEMDVDAAIHRNRELTAIGLPQINGEVSFQNNLVLPTTVLPANAFNPNAPADELIGLQFGTDYNATAALSASQLLFDGTYIFGLKAAKKYVQLNQYGKEQTLNDIRKDIADAYGMAVLARESLVLLEEDYETLQSLLEETRKTFEAGFREELDVDQLSLQLSNLENMKKKAENDVSVTLNLLKFQMGMPVQDPLILSETIESLVGLSYMPEMIDSEPQLASHTDILTFQTNIDLRALNVKVEKMANFPSLTGFFTTQQQAFRNDISFFGAGSDWYQGTFWGASLKVPIFSGLARHNKIQQAKIEVERAVMQRDQTEQRLILQIATEKANYANAIDIYNTEKESLALAKKINTRTQIKFQEGISGSFELKEIQTQLLNTQRNFILAAYDVVSTKAALQKALDIK